MSEIPPQRTPHGISRRAFVRARGIGAGAALVLPLGSACTASGAQAETAAPGAASAAGQARGWEMVPEILARIRPPQPSPRATSSSPGTARWATGGR